MKSSKSKKCTCANSYLFPHRADKCALRAVKSAMKNSDTDPTTDEPSADPITMPAPPVTTLAEEVKLKPKTTPKPKSKSKPKPEPQKERSAPVDSNEGCVVVGTPDAPPASDINEQDLSVQGLGIENLNIGDGAVDVHPPPSTAAAEGRLDDTKLPSNEPVSPPAIPNATYAVSRADTFVLPTAVDVNAVVAAEVVATAEDEERARTVELEQQRQEQQRQQEALAAQVRESERVLRLQQEQQRQAHESEMQTMRLRQHQMEMSMQQERLRMEQERRYQEERNRMSSYSSPPARGRYGVTQSGTVCKNCIKVGGRCHQHR